MNRTYWISPAAEADLDAIFEHYLFEGGPELVYKVAGDFERAFKRLAQFPRIGHR